MTELDDTVRRRGKQVGGIAPLSPASKAALGETVAGNLRQAIIEGGFAPGQHLREADLAEAMEVSRGPVRDAFVQLEREGLVTLRRHRGAEVVSLTGDDAEEVYTLRMALERLAIRRAVTRVDQTHIDELDQILASMTHLRDDYEPKEAAALDVAFHDVIYRAADHRRLMRSWEQIRSQVYVFLYSRSVASHDFNSIAYTEHTAIRELLVDGDPERAVEAIETHLEGAYERLRTSDDTIR